MPFPLIPVLIGIGTGSIAGFALKRRRKPRGLTPERLQIYEAALINLKDPNKLRALSNVYRAEGLISQAEMLEKRANLKELSPEEKAKNAARFKEGMASKDPKFVEQVAKEHDERGATSAAFNLRKYAEGLGK
jgi:hypothetical protein